MLQRNPLSAEKYPTDPYSPCWCKSGRKWKFCHKDREKQSPLPFGEQLHKQAAHYRLGPCLHPEASPDSCSEATAIKSHTVQRRGGLTAVAEGGHVYSVKAGFFDIGKNDGLVTPKLVGTRDASTFPGFCNRHDTEMFRPVETSDAPLDEWNAFLLSYRAIAYELASKGASLASLSTRRDNTDRGAPFEKQVAIQTFLQNEFVQTTRGMADARRWKDAYDAAFLARDCGGFKFYCMSFEGPLPFVVAGAFMPEYDFGGKQLQHLGTPTPAEHVAINVTLLGGRTVATFCWSDGPLKAAAGLIESLAGIPDARKADAVLLLAIEHSENIYFRPSWWDNLSAESRALLDAKIAGGMLTRSPDALVETTMPVLQGGVAQVLDRR